MAPFHEVESNILGRKVRETRLQKGDIVTFCGVRVEIVNDNKARLRSDGRNTSKVEVGDGQTLSDRIFSPRKRIKGPANRIIKRQTIFLSDRYSLNTRRIEWRDR